MGSFFFCVAKSKMSAVSRPEMMELNIKYNQYGGIFFSTGGENLLAIDFKDINKKIA